MYLKAGKKALSNGIPKIEKYSIDDFYKDLAEIKENIEDDEICHSIHDGIMEAFITSISFNLYTKKELIELSKLILDVLNFKFSRHYS